MKKIHFAILPFMFLLLVFLSCEAEESDCGEGTSDLVQIFSDEFFKRPSEIYWGETSGIRSFTYNFTVDNICPKKNPKISVGLFLKISNAGSPRPISAEAGVQTCFGVQATKLTLIPKSDQFKYESDPTTIGMKQCFDGQASAKLYPYITLSFNTLGSSQADSLYMIQAVSDVYMDAEYSKPK